MELIREVYGRTLCELAEEKPELFVLDADLANSTKSILFGKQYPDRFLNCGVSEYTMFGIAAGLAKRGKIPFTNTFAVFTSSIGALPARQLLSYSGLNVKMVGAYSGLSNAFDGPSHHSIEDLAVMRALPGMVVMVPSDPVQTRWMTRAAAEHQGPVYFRLARGAYPSVYGPEETFTIGMAKILRQGTDAAIITCGFLVNMAMDAAEVLSKEGIDVRVVDMFTIKPLDQEMVLQCAQETGAIVTAEEHSVIGGLGSAVAECLATSGIKVIQGMVGLQDTHAETGSYAELLTKYGMDTDAMVRKVRQVLEKK